ncbi:transposase [Pseudoneobacillus sp. C159]
MSRKLRIWYPGAQYHVTVRGVRRTDLFYDENDRFFYLFLLEKAKSRYTFHLLSFCLMSNHVHLQLQTEEIPLSTIMHWVNTKYAKYFNKKYDTCGHVFEKRYGDELVETSEYELDLSKYIHLNPVRAKIVERLEDYPWSSYHIYVRQLNSSLVDTKRILSYFLEPQVENYDAFLRQPGYTNLWFSYDGKLLGHRDRAEKESSR